MSTANGGQIVVDFTINDGQATVAVKRAGQTLQNLKGTLEQTAASVKKLETHNDSMGRKFRDLVLTMGQLRFVAMDVNDIFLRLPLAILKSAGELEKMEVLMRGLSTSLTEAGRAAEGAKGFAYITKMAREAPFDIKSLSDSFVKFKTAGIDPMNGSMQAMVDSVARFGGSGEQLKRASVAIQQMAGKGVVSMEELRQQLGEAVPDAMQAMADGMGMTMAELAKAVSKGTVAAGPAIEKMLLQMRVRNSGAAADMMQTWVGFTSRLQTEMDLAAKQIADSGFGDAAKKATDQIINALNSVDFRRVGSDVGAYLGETTEALVSFTRFLVEHAGTIKLVAEAWLGYKVATSLVVPMLGQMKDAYGGVTKIFRDQMQAQIDAANSTRMLAVNSAQAAHDQAKAVQDGWIAQRKVIQDKLLQAGKEGAADRVRLAEVARAAQMEVSIMDERNRQILARQQVLQTALAATTRNSINVPGENGFRGRTSIVAEERALQMQFQANEAQAAAYQRRLALLEAQKNATGVQSAALKRELAYVERQMQANGFAITQTATAITTAEEATTKLSRAKAAMAAVSRGAGIAVAALGGPIGVITLALIAGAAAWEKWGNSAVKAAAAARRANALAADASDLKTLQDRKATLESDVKRLEKEAAQAVTFEDLAGSGLPSMRQKSPEERAAESKALKDAQAELASTVVSIGRARESVLRADAQDFQNQMKNSTADKLRAIEVAQKDEGRKMEQNFRDSVKGMDDQSKEYQAKRNDYTKKRTDLLIQADKDQLKVIEAAKGAIDSQILARPVGMSDAQFQALRDEADRLQQAAEDVKGRVTSASKTLDTANKFLDDKKKPKTKGEKTGYDKVDSLIGNLEAKNASIKAEIASFNATMGLVDAGVAAAAAMDAKAKAGAYKYKDEKGKVTDITPEQLKKAKELAASTAYMEEQFKIAEKIAAKGLEIKADYAEALAVLADPMNGSAMRDNSKAGAFTEMLARSKLDIDKFAEQMGITVDVAKSRIAEVKTQLATIDASAAVSTMVKSSETMRVGMIHNERERLTESIRIETELSTARYAAEIKRMRDNGATIESIQQAEAAFYKWKETIALDNAEKLKSPMQRLADDWADSAGAMERSTAQWASNGVDAVTNFVRTGKLEFGSFVTDILAGLLKIEIQKNMAGAMKGAGGEGGWMSSLGTWFSGLFSFADGGIMSSAGSVPLKKYANGGIAKSPQLALYGEGSMNEAYVPLPDGRSIPVTMKTDGAAQAPTGSGVPSSVTVNVINQTSQQVNAQQGQPRFDGKQMILDVVLTAANTPGTFRDGMKGAML